MRRLPVIAAMVLLGGTYLVAGLLKVASPDRFLLDVQSFQILPYPLAWATAFFLPWLEIFAAVSVFTRRLFCGACAWLALLSVVFIGALISAEVRGFDLDCGCFGDWLVFPNLATHLFYNTLLALAALGLIWEAGHRTRAARNSSPTDHDKIDSSKE